MSNWAETLGSTVDITLPRGLVQVTHTTGTISRLTPALIVVTIEDGRELKFERKVLAPDYPERRQHGTFTNGRKALMSVIGPEADK